MKFCKKCAPCRVDCFWKEILAQAYVVIHCTRDDKLVACLNLWPCSDCVCVGFTVLESPAEKGSPEYLEAINVFG